MIALRGSFDTLEVRNSPQLIGWDEKESNQANISIRIYSKIFPTSRVKKAKTSNHL
jgi:hypothetical protein